MRRTLAPTLILTAIVTMAACSSNDATIEPMGGTGGSADNSSSANSSNSTTTDALIKALEDRLVELEKKLADTKPAPADTSELDALKTELAKATQDLKDLQTCRNGGTCTEFANISAQIQRINDSVCDWIFGCCNENEARTAFGPSVNTAADCKATLAQYSLHAGTPNVSKFFDLESDFDIDFLNIPEITAGIESGDYELNVGALDDCILMIDAQGCREDEGSCSEYHPGTRACDNGTLVTGLKTEGEPCRNDSQINSCVGGMVCQGDDFNKVCVQVEGSHCTLNSECPQGGDLEQYYCDSVSDTCKELGKIDEDCAWIDPTFQATINSVSQGCYPDLECNPLTNKCAATCSEDTLCRFDRNCEGDLICNETAFENLEYRDGETGDGLCTPPLQDGATSNHGDDCASHEYSGETGSPGICNITLKDAGDDCASGEDCKTSSCSNLKCDAPCDIANDNACDAATYCALNVCKPLKGDGALCGDDQECSSSSLCRLNTCHPIVSAGETCTVDRRVNTETPATLNRLMDLCPDLYYCAPNGTCTSQSATSNCIENYECGTGRQCIGGGCRTTLDKFADCSGESTFCDEGTSCISWMNEAGGTTLQCLPITADEGELPLDTFCGESDGAECESNRCLPITNGTRICQTGLSAGESCSVAIGGDITVDPCQEGNYCHLDSPWANLGPWTGTCTAQLPGGQRCDVSQELYYDAAAPQCQGNNTCERWAGTGLVCPSTDNYSTSQCTAYPD